MSDEEFDEEFTDRKPYWRCQECGHEDHNKALPTDREAFYRKVAQKGSPKCPKCKSEAFMPVGF